MPSFPHLFRYGHDLIDYASCPVSRCTRYISTFEEALNCPQPLSVLLLSSPSRYYEDPNRLGTPLYLAKPAYEFSAGDIAARM